MHVLVTGADGFVGRALVEHLAGRGLAVTAATRGAGPALAAGRRVAVGDLGRAPDWREALAGVGAVVHAAGRAHVPTRSPADEADAVRVNRDGSLALFDAARRSGVRLFVFLSSTTVLGGRTVPGRPFRDDDPYAPETPYARSKRDAETALASAAASGPTALVTLRPPLIVGPGVKGNLSALIRLARTPLPLPFGGVGNRRTLLSLPNLLHAIGYVLDHPRPGEVAGTYNLGDARPVSTAEIVASLRRGLGRRPNLLPVPAALARRLARSGGAAGRLYGDLEVASDRFRARFGDADGVETCTALEEAARASA